uniref:Uncharacterized protein n=1 Tax=Anguilla anguilla TaxID=7936 RepID=A0A0E9SM29_ANGAN
MQLFSWRRETRQADRAIPTSSHTPVMSWAASYWRVLR